MTPSGFKKEKKKTTHIWLKKIALEDFILYSIQFHQYLYWENMVF